MPSNPISYVVIEVRSEKEEADIVNLLVSKTKATFIRTEDIMEYALGKTGKNEPTEAAPTPSTPPMILSTTPIMGLLESAGLINIDNDNETSEKNGGSSAGATPVKRELQASPSSDQPLAKRANYHSDDGEIYTSEQPTSSSVIDQMIQDRTDDSSNMDLSNNIGWLLSSVSDIYNTTNDLESSENTVDTYATTCQVCNQSNKSNSLSYKYRARHAIIHTAIMKCHCFVAECGFKTKHPAAFRKHLVSQHAITAGPITETITKEEEEELREMVNKCFPAYK